MFALTGYLECGVLKGNNLHTLQAVDNLTRGGTDPFFWGLDANVLLGAWDEHLVDDIMWLDRIKVGII